MMYRKRFALALKFLLSSAFIMLGAALMAEAPPKPPVTLKGATRQEPQSLNGWTRVADVGKEVTSWKIPYELAINGGCFVVTAYDTSGNESLPSEQMCLEPL